MAAIYTPILTLPFAASRRVSPLVTFTRSSTGTYWGPGGVMRTAAANAPRIDHDPATGECRGLLVEEQRTNLALRSQEFGTTWSILGASISSDAALAPDGTTTMDKLVEDASTGQHYVAQSVAGTGTLGTAYTISVYAKAGELSNVALTAQGEGYAVFNLSTGAIVQTGGHTCQMQACGGGIYRCSATVTRTNTTPSWYITTFVGAVSHAGASGSGLYLWGAQVEAGAFPTSYIPTSGATATRSADTATIALADVAGWNANEGTVLVEFSQPHAISGNASIVQLHGTSGNAMTLLTATAPDRVLWYTDTGGTNQTSINAGSISLGSTMRLVGAFKVDDFATSLNGGAVVSDVAGAVPTISGLSIGASSTGALRWSGHIRHLTLYPRRLANADLISLTSGA